NLVEAKFLEEVRSLKLPENRIGPLCILTTRDIESLQDFSSGISVETMFKEYCKFLVTGYRDRTGSFHGFLIKTYRGKQTRQSFVQAKVQRLLEAILKEM